MKKINKIILLLLINIWYLDFTFPKKQEQLTFNFNRTPLINIINLLAKKRQINIILPQLAAELDILKKQTVTYQSSTNKIGLKKAWNLLTTFLDIAGFNISKKKKDTFVIIKNNVANQTLSRNPAPLYIDTNIDQLPKDEIVIRYIYYLKNLKVPAANDNENGIFRIAKDMLSPGATLVPEPKSNSFVIVDKAPNVASIINIIKNIDDTGLKQSIEVLPLSNVDAAQVVKIFNLLKKASGEDKSLRESKGISYSYFKTNPQIFADIRNNAIVLMGTITALDHIREFIYEFVDVPVDSGKSILHIYDLQYLDAEKFVPVLQRIVSRQPTKAQGTQSTPEGYEKFFDGVQIAAQMTEEVKRISADEYREDLYPANSNIDSKTYGEIKGLQGTSMVGGNRLIIAALQEDWLYIKKLIEQLDTPQLQVILEVMVVDFVLDNLTKLNADTRNLTGTCACPGGLDFISSNIDQPFRVLGSDPATLAQDLLAVVSDDNIFSVIDPNSTLIAFNDPKTPGIFGLLQILNSYIKSKVLSHPFVVTSNNKRATIEHQDIKRARGELYTVSTGSFTIPIVDVTSTLVVDIIPRLSSKDRLKLEIRIQVEEFIRDTLNRISRIISTTASMQSGQILALGGLIRSEKNDLLTQTPIIGSVPILGTFFKGYTKRDIKNVIAIFVSPIIISPKMDPKSAIYTQDKISDTYNDINKEYSNTRDPIVHFLFKNSNADEELANEFLAHTQLPKAYLINKPNIVKENQKFVAKFKDRKIIANSKSETKIAPEKINNDQIKKVLAMEDNSFLNKSILT